MALTAILRRSASSIAVRVVGIQRQSRHCAAFFSAGANQFQFHPADTYSPIRNFSSAPSVKKPLSSDEKLLKVIQSEVDVVVDSDDFGKVVYVPSDFPFRIQDNIGESTVTLTREYQDETVTVEVSMPSLEEGEEDDQENDEESENASIIPLIVTVSKTNGTSMEFDVVALPDEIRIRTISLNNENKPDYEGPEFLDLDENLQKAFLKYLEVRGIKASATNFLHEYMMEKDSREYINWLNDVKKFVQA